MVETFATSIFNILVYLFCECQGRGRPTPTENRRQGKFGAHRPKLFAAIELF
jgi:hypothetical protein